MDGASVRRVARGEPWFYLRLGPAGRPDAYSGSAGEPIDIQDECLDVTVVGQTFRVETGSRIPCPESSSRGRENVPTTALEEPALARLHRQLRWIVPFSRFPES